MPTIVDVLGEPVGVVVECAVQEAGEQARFLAREDGQREFVGPNLALLISTRFWSMGAHCHSPCVTWAQTIAEAARCRARSHRM
ncbi:hypothetical protein BEK98_22280 [Streptomyces diastatochromogenes]|uniref:Uncharacterized protein n=1 Tax=Streptomyces diastatochromogenes TaxID=42236 RepID=A0A233SCS1_STRDA|nr:hypothetical protein [Streptomyces diastatochromogenes]OXY93443.1 hypothetical protein BEK98_22280 [Streptomyces diastatochromogenes]